MVAAGVICVAARYAMRWAEDAAMEESRWEDLMAMAREQLDAAEVAVARFQEAEIPDARLQAAGLAKIEALELAAFALMALVRVPGGDLVGLDSRGLERLQ